MTSTVVFSHFHEIWTYQLTKLHNQEEGDALAALPQTLEDVGMLQAPARRASDEAKEKSL